MSHSNAFRKEMPEYLLRKWGKMRQVVMLSFRPNAKFATAWRNKCMVTEFSTSHMGSQNEVTEL
jgi:hypothetical protein